MLTQEDALKDLAEAVVKRDRKKVEELSHQVVAEKLDAFEAIDKGLAAGMEIVGQKFDCHEYFVLELLMAAKAMMTGIKDVIKLFEEAGVRDRHRIMVGGAPISQKWCDAVGADAYAPNAAQAVEVAQILLRKRRTA